MRRLLFLLAMNCVWAAPDKVIIIPPAARPQQESPFLSVPVGPQGPLYGAGLSAEGQREAAALVAKLIKEGSITYLAAYRGDYQTIETLAPLANALFPKHAPTNPFVYAPKSIDLPTPAKLKRDLANMKGGIAIICWKESEISQLKHYLGEHP